MKVKYNAKIKGKFKNKDVTMSIPVEIDLNELVQNEAVSQAEYDGLSDVSIVEVTQSSEEYTQMEIPFEDCCENTDCAANEQLDELNNATASGNYVPYGTHAQEAFEQETEDEEESESDWEQQSNYTSYTSVAKARAENQNEAISFVPKFQNGYVPYQRRIVPIPNSYTKHKFN